MKLAFKYSLVDYTDEPISSVLAFFKNGILMYKLQPFSSKSIVVYI
jgi:hypothetical protein